MNRVGAALSLSRIRLNHAATARNQVLDEAGRLFASYEGWDPAHITASLVARENLGSTGIGHGVAIPHARLRGLRSAVAGFIRVSMAISFEAPDGKPVSEFLVLLVPEQATEEHLQMLAQAARMFDDRAFRDYLHGQQDAQAVLHAFHSWPVIEA